MAPDARPVAFRSPALDLGLFWLAIAAALALWAAAAQPATSVRWPEGDVVTLAPSPPPETVLSVWVWWDARDRKEGWIVLEPGARWPSADEPYWRRRVHRGWTLVTWSPMAWLPRDKALTLRLAEGRPDAWYVAEPAAAAHYGLRELSSLRGLLVALSIAAAGTAFVVADGRRRFLNLGWWHLALLAITALGLMLRLHSLGTQSLWFDEVLTAIGAQNLDWVLYTPHVFGHPPAQYLVGWLAQTPGNSEVTLRLPFLVAGVATVAAVGVLGARLLGRPTGLLVALTLACSPLHVELSQTARPYAPFLLLAVVAVLVLQDAVSRGGRCWWLLFTAISTVAIYTHYLGGLVLLLTAVAAMLALSARGWRGSGAAAISFAGVAVLLAPWAPVLARLAGGHADKPPMSVLDHHLVGVLAHEFLGPGVATWIGVALVVRGLVAVARDFRVAGLLLAWVAVPIVPLWVGQPHHFVAARHLVLLLVPLSLLLAHGMVTSARDVATVVRQRGRGPRWAVRVAGGATLLALVAAWTLPVGAGLSHYYGSRLGYDWREVAGVLETVVPSEGRVLATVGAGYPLRHYWRRDVEVIDATSDARLATCGGCWFVSHLGWDRPPDLDTWLAAHATAVAEVPSSWSLPGVRVWRLLR